MGAASFSKTYKGDLSFTEVQKEFRDLLNEDSHRYSDKGEYYGVTGVKNSHETFDSENKAFDYLLSKSEKWGDAYAAKITVKQVDQEKLNKKVSENKKLAKLKEKVDSLKKETEAAQALLLNKRKEEGFLKCSHCESKLNSAFINSINLSEAIDHYNKTEEVIGGRCPICVKNALQLPKREFKNYLSLMKELEDSTLKGRTLKEEIREEVASKGKDKTYWLVVGWAAE